MPGLAFVTCPRPDEQVCCHKTKTKIASFFFLYKTWASEFFYHHANCTFFMIMFEKSINPIKYWIITFHSTFIAWGDIRIYCKHLMLINRLHTDKAKWNFPCIFVLLSLQGTWKWLVAHYPRCQQFCRIKTPVCRVWCMHACMHTSYKQKITTHDN